MSGNGLPGGYKRATSLNDKPAYAYPENCGDFDSPAWICFGIYDKQLSRRGSLVTTLGLYMPESATMPSTVSWENERIGYKTRGLANAAHKTISESGGIKNYLNNLHGGTNSLTDVLQAKTAEMATQIMGEGGGQDGAKDIASGVAGNFAIEGGARILSGALGTQDGGNLSQDQALGITIGSIRNPYLTALFRGVDFRTFEFSFNFFPHNENECNTIRDMIKILRMASLPQYQSFGTAGDMLLDYPMEFDISYKWGASDNNYIHRFKPAVLVGLDTDYTGYGSWVSMRNGMPASIKLNLRFTELEIVTRRDVHIGY